MKRFLIVILLFFVLGLYGCGNKNADAAKEVADLIDLIAETIGLDSEDAIVAARAAYDALTETQKALVKNYADLENAERDLATIVNQGAADPVIALIDALPTIVSLDDENAIVAARAAYDALTRAQQILISNTLRQKLDNAENDLEALKEAAENQEEVNQGAADAVVALIDALPETLTLDDQAAVTSARAAYDALTAAQKELVAQAKLEALVAAETSLQELLDEAAAAAVVALIDALPEALTLDDQEDVEAARAAYDALTAAQKELVAQVKLDALVAAEADIQDLLDAAAAAAVEALIDALPAVEALTYEDEADVEAARAAYDTLTAAQKELVAQAKLDALVAAEEKMEEVMEKYAADLAEANVVADLIAALPEPVSLADEADVEAAETAYGNLTADQQVLVNNYAKLETARARIDKLNDPDFQVIFEAIETLGTRITDDVEMPDTVTWSLKEGEDATVFDVATGKLLKNVFSVKNIVLVATHKTVTTKFEEVTINFGMLAEGEGGLFYHDLSAYVNETHWNGWTMTKTYTVADQVKTESLFHINQVVVVSGKSGEVDYSVLTTSASTSWSSAGSAILNDGPESISFEINQACGPYAVRLAVVAKANGDIKGIYTDLSEVVTLEAGEFIWLARYLDDNPAFNLAKEVHFSTTTKLTLQKIQIPTYTVTLRIDDETSEQFSVKEGAQFAKPTDPIKAGHTFDGWYRSSTFSPDSKVTFPYTVTGGATFYAKFDPIA